MIVWPDANTHQASRAPLLIDVELNRLEDRIEHWIRFGRSTAEMIIDRQCLILILNSANVFGLVRRPANDFGLTFCRIDILHEVGRADAYQRLPRARPGAVIVFSISSWPTGERVLRTINTAEATRIEAAEVLRDDWCYSPQSSCCGR